MAIKKPEVGKTYIRTYTYDPRRKHEVRVTEVEGRKVWGYHTDSKNPCTLASDYVNFLWEEVEVGKPQVGKTYDYDYGYSRGYADGVMAEWQGANRLRESLTRQLGDVRAQISELQVELAKPKPTPTPFINYPLKKRTFGPKPPEPPKPPKPPKVGKRYRITNPNTGTSPGKFTVGSVLDHKVFSPNGEIITHRWQYWIWEEVN